ncbi:hypothetical protein [Halobellus salinisoli]|uniref:hypothetical protein n=1 Tax=Halobellus salinisoli TaxID=3108500 RepID=UPI00300B9438
MDNERTTRRTLIRSAAVGLGLGALATPATGRRSKGGNGRGRETDNGKISLVDGDAEYRIYIAGDGDGAADTVEAFAYPKEPVLASEDPVGGLFDAGDIEKTPNGQTLHHTLRFFQGLLIRKDRGKPYVMVHQGDGRFVSKGQSINFEARTTEELWALFEGAGFDPDFAALEPFATLAGGRWRALARDVVQFAGDPETSRSIAWSITRVDFYTRGGGRPSPELSALYAIYPNLDEDGRPTTANPLDPTIRPMPGPTRETGRELIADGRANLGGQ